MNTLWQAVDEPLAVPTAARGIRTDSPLLDGREITSGQMMEALCEVVEPELWPNGLGANFDLGAGRRAEINWVMFDGVAAGVFDSRDDNLWHTKSTDFFSVARAFAMFAQSLGGAQ